MDVMDYTDEDIRAAEVARRKVPLREVEVARDLTPERNLSW